MWRRDEGLKNDPVILPLCPEGHLHLLVFSQGCGTVEADCWLLEKQLVGHPRVGEARFSYWYMVLSFSSHMGRCVQIGNKPVDFLKCHFHAELHSKTGIVNSQKIPASTELKYSAPVCTHTSEMSGRSHCFPVHTAFLRWPPVPDSA